MDDPKALHDGRPAIFFRDPGAHACLLGRLGLQQRWCECPQLSGRLDARPSRPPLLSSSS